MKKLLIISLLLVAMLLSGCLWVKSDTKLLTVELKGVLADTQEIWVSGVDKAYIVDLGTKTRAILSLEPGHWWIEALSRDTDGEVLSISKQIKVLGARQTAITPSLEKTNVEKAGTRSKVLTHTWLLTGGVDLSWESDGEEEAHGLWEVWKRHSDSNLWIKIGETAPEIKNFIHSNPKAHEYVYAVRYVPEGSDAFPSALEYSKGGHVGRAELTWDFKHYFAPVRASFSVQGLGGELDIEPEYSDLIAHFKNEEFYEQRLEILARLGFTIKGEIRSLLAVLVESSPDNELSLEDWSHYEDKRIFFEPNWIVRTKGVGTAGFDLPWYLDYIRIPGAHAETTGDHSVRIAVLDSGLKAGTLPRSVQVVSGYNFVNSSYNTHDDFFRQHGTKVAQTISMAIPTVTIQPIKVLDSSGLGRQFQVSEGILFAAGLHDTIPNPYPAQIINMSLGQSGILDTIRQKVDRIAANTDILMIAASGNSSGGAKDPGLFYPAALSQVVAVGAVLPGQQGPQRAYYSHFGPNLDLVAPPSFEEGTSFSTALVSGVAGLMLAQGMDLRDIRSVLATTAMDLGLPGWDEEFGHGLVNAEWAVKGITELKLRVENEGGEAIEAIVPLKGHSKTFYLPPGEYLATAYLPGLGDYTAQPISLTVLEHEEVKGHLTLVEKGP